MSGRRRPSGGRRLLRRLFSILARTAVVLVGIVLTLVVVYRLVDPPITPLMVLRLIEGDGLSRTVVGLEEVAPALSRAVVAAEDNRFCTHAGVDWRAVREAVGEYRERGRLRGASTITMQVARNLFLWPGGGFPRKVVETGIAFTIDAFWPKRRIVEVYVNLAEWGPGIFGAEAAAQAHFGKPAAALSTREAALLAAVLPSPRNWSPAPAGPYVASRASSIQRRIGQLGPLLDCLPK